MQSKGRQRGGVKRCDVRKKDIFPRENAGLLLTDGCRRIRGYLLGCFSRGKEYHDWDKHQFSRCTRTLNPLSVRHVERIIGFYRKICTEFSFTPIRQGRSTILRIELADRDGEAIPTREVRRRLVGYIEATVRKNGVAHVDREFLKHFWRATGLPAEIIHLVWLKTRKMAGLRVRWRGENNGRKMVITGLSSLTHFPPGPFSSLCEREGIKPKTTGLTPRFGGQSAPLRVAPTDAGNVTPHRLPTANAEQAGRDDHPPDDRRPFGASARDSCGARARASPGAPRPHGPPPQPKTVRRAPNWPPLAVAGRWVSGAKLARLATLLAVTSMRGPHDANFRVKWIFVYARNYAWRALREGFGVPEIVAAYADGVGRSHEDSLDADRAPSGDEFHREPSRVPSAAVAYAMRALLADTQSREERWAAIFARGPRAGPAIALAPRVSDPAPAAAAGAPAKPRGRSRARVPDPTPAAAPEKTVPKTAKDVRPRSTVADLRALLERARLRDRADTGASSAPGLEVDLTAGELIAWLREAKQISPAQFAALAFGWRQKLIAQCREAKLRQKPDNI